MEHTGSSPVGGPNACPFVALEFDRDRRSDQPDYRHRCYAEPTPAPRAIAHQEQYCLSPRFATCPIFQDWAARAAARPVHGNPEEEDQPGPAAAAASSEAAAQVAADAVTSPDDVDAQRPPAGPVDTQPEPGPEEEQQLQAPLFDAQPQQAIHAEAATGAGAPAAPDSSADTVQPPPGDEVAAPAFLAGRSARPSARSSLAGPSRTPANAADEHGHREEVVPSWEIDGRYGAQEPVARDGRGRQTLTLIAVVAILAIGVLAVFVIWGLVNGTPGASPTPPASVPPGASASASPLTSGAASAGPTATALPSATPAPSPQVTFRNYRIKPGDTLNKIARHFKVAVADILAANPQITDANHIEPGQTIVIPVPVTSPAP